MKKNGEFFADEHVQNKTKTKWYRADLKNAWYIYERNTHQLAAGTPSGWFRRNVCSEGLNRPRYSDSIVIKNDILRISLKFLRWVPVSVGKYLKKGIKCSEDEELNARSFSVEINASVSIFRRLSKNMQSEIRICMLCVCFLQLSIDNTCAKYTL